MKTFKCTKCLEAKEADLFCKSSSRKNGLQPRCKACEKAYRQENKKLIAARAKKYKEDNPEKVKESHKKYVEKNKDYLKDWHKKWHIAHRDARLEKSKINYQKNKAIINASNKQWQERNQDKYRQYQIAYRKENKEKEKLRVAAWREKNLERILAESRLNYQVNKEKELKRKSEWNKKNPHKPLQYTASRRAAKLNATPPWLSEEQKLQISLIYKEASKMRSKGNDVHVDHIIPLQNPLVCGLHVPWNLEILSAFDNLSKANKFTIEM